MPWYDPAFSYKKAIVIPYTNVSGTSDLLDFPVLVSVSDPSLISMTNGGLMASPVGNDLLFVNETETRELPYEIATFNGAIGSLLAWVRVPVLSATQDTLLYLYFGNSTVTASLASPTQVWDSTYRGVWHMEDDAFVSPTTPLSLYGLTATSSTLSTAATLASSTGGSSTTVNTSLPGSGSGYYELFGLGGTSSVNATLPAPSGKGWLFDSVVLEGKTLLGGTFTLIGTVNIGSGTLGSCTLYLRIYKRSSGGAFTSICTGNSTSFTITTTPTAHTITCSGISSTTFTTGDKVYVDAFLFGAPATTRSIRVTVSSTSTGLASALEADTQGFQDPSAPSLTNVADSTANANTGTATATTSTLSTAGEVGNALSFNGSSNVITLSKTPLTGTGSYSVFAWIKTSTSATRQAIITWGGAGTNTQELLYVTSSNTLQNDLSGGSTGPQSSVTVTDGQWHHVGVVNTAGSFQLYVDGVASGSPVSLSPALTSGSPQIGNDGASHYFHGALDEVRVESTARTPAWVATLYANQNSPTNFLQTGQTIPSLNNREVTALSANFATGSLYSADQLNVTSRGAVFSLISSPTVGTGQTLTVSIQGKDITSGAYYPIVTLANLSFTIFSFTIYPGIAPSQGTLNSILPRIWRVTVTPSTTDTYTCLVGASLIP